MLLGKALFVAILLNRNIVNHFKAHEIHDRIMGLNVHYIVATFEAIQLSCFNIFRY